MPIIAGFDIATTTGAAVLDGSKVITAIAYRSQGADDAAVFNSFRYWFRDFILDHDVTEIAIEQPLRSDFKVPDRRPGAAPGAEYTPATFKTFLRLYGLRAHALEVCKSLGVPATEVNMMSWRKSFTGDARATKDTTLRIAQRLVPGLTSLDAGEAVGIAWWLNGDINMRAAIARKPTDMFGMKIK
jgi:hypothetical protein